MIKTIGVGQLRVGMFVHELKASWLEHSFRRSRFKLRTERRLTRIRDSGIRELSIDTDKGLDIEPLVAAGAVQDPMTAACIDRPGSSGSDASKPDPIEPEATEPDRGKVESSHQRKPDREAALAEAAALYRRSVPKIASMFGKARLGKVFDIAECEPLVEEIFDSVLRHPGALISVVRLKHRDENTHMHAVAVCALMLGQGRELGMQGEELRQAGMAGMLHDLGKACIPLEILNKPGKLTDEEFALVKTHPVRGHALLQECGTASAVVLDVCLHHHEKLDGSGYPHGLDAGRISRFARMGAVCDVYDAVTSDRPYKAGWDPGEALRRMARWKGHFDTAALQALVKAVGIYPVGALVRLKSGHLAVVVEHNPASLLAPKVKAIYSMARNELTEPLEIDLAASGCTDKVLGCESPQAWSFGDLNALCGLAPP